MISEKQLKEEIKITKAFIKKIEKNVKWLHTEEIYSYLDGLNYCLNGKLE
jgi:hypothetical protein